MEAKINKILKAPIYFWHRFISPALPPACRFYPSCSEYAKQALIMRGAVAGSLLAIDRYLRCNGVDRDLYPYDPTLRKLLDPVPERKAKPPRK